MGPTSKDATVRRQIADSEFQGAVLEELRGIREVLNRLAGSHELDKEQVNERLDKVEERVFDLERARPS